VILKDAKRFSISFPSGSGEASTLLVGWIETAEELSF
jgi:hypothetical protein